MRGDSNRRETIDVSHFWMIDDDNAKAVLITDKPYQDRAFEEFRPWFQSANADMIHEPLVAVLEEMVRQLDRPDFRPGFRAAAAHVRDAIDCLKKADQEIRKAWTPEGGWPP